MTNLLERVGGRLRAEDAFVIGRVALVIVILAIIVVAAALALIVPD